MRETQKNGDVPVPTVQAEAEFAAQKCLTSSLDVEDGSIHCPLSFSAFTKREKVGFKLSSEAGPVSN